MRHECWLMLASAGGTSATCFTPLLCMRCCVAHVAAPMTMSPAQPATICVLVQGGSLWTVLQYIVSEARELAASPPFDDPLELPACVFAAVRWLSVCVVHGLLQSV